MGEVIYLLGALVLMLGQKVRKMREVVSIKFLRCDTESEMRIKKPLLMLMS